MVRLEEFRSFLRVVDVGGFSKAASELGLTQGTISNHVSALEKHFDVRLLRRGVKGVQLTEEGRMLYEKARSILETVENLRRDIEIRKRGFKGLITVAASTIPGEHILPGYVLQFRKLRPDVDFKIDVMDSVRAWGLLKAGNVDFAAVGTLNVDNAEAYERVKIAEERLVLIVPPNHPLAKRRTVKAEEVVEYPYVNREAGSGTRREVEVILQKAGVPTSKLKVVLEVGSTESVITSVSKGVGISVVSGIAAKRAEKTGLVVAREFTDLTSTRSFYLVLRRGVTSNSVKAFWDFMKARVKG